MRVYKSAWRLKLMGMILLVAACLLSISFFFAYQIFIQRLEQTNLLATTLAFQQTEQNINRKIQQASNDVNQLLYQNEVLDYLNGRPAILPEESLNMRRIMDVLTSVISRNTDLDSVLLVDGKGRTLGATAWGRTVVTSISQDSGTYRYFHKADTKYPYFVWTGVAEVKPYFEELGSILPVFEKHEGKMERMLVGVRTISYAVQDERLAYLMLTLSDKAIMECYLQVLYNQNTAILLDENRKVISSTDGRVLGGELFYNESIPDDNTAGSFRAVDKEKKGYQIIYYKLQQHDWMLVNEVPKSSYWRQASELRQILLFLWISTLTLMLLFFTIWITKYTKPVVWLIQGMKKMQSGDLSPVFYSPSEVQELDELGEQFVTTVSKMNSLIDKVKDMEDQKHKEEVRTLQYQINPHFLYNSLNSIRWMAVLNDNPKIADAILLLAKIIEPIMRSPSFYWTVREELAFIDSYVKMLTLRFGGGLEYECVCEPDLYEYTFVRFTLQPILENCFTHGMIPDDMLHITVRLSFENHILYASVTNTGSRIEKERLNRLNQALAEHEEPGGEAGNIGLLNVNKRLYLLYGKDACIFVRSDECMETTVFIEIPEYHKG